jgi:oligopeptide transport system substrate-binding protein
MFPRILFACGLVLVTVIVIAASHGTHRRADFVYVNPAGIHTLDPARMSWTQDIRLALNIWEGLITWDARTLEAVEAVAYFPPEISADRRTYTFHLRDDARWSNGDTVTSRDFVRGWRRAMEPGTATDYASLFTSLIVGAKEYVDWRNQAVVELTRPGRGDTEAQPGHASALQAHSDEMESRFVTVGLRAPNDRTLIVELTRPCPYFVGLTGFAPFMPCHASIELLREKTDCVPLTAQGLVVYDPQWTKPDYRKGTYTGLISNGPYHLDRWMFKRGARLSVNPFHRDRDRIACKTIDMVEYSDTAASLLAYEAEEVDFLTDLNVPFDHEIARLARSGERTDFHPCTLLATYFFSFNCVSETVGGRRNPFTDARIRKAFTLAIDRDQLTDKVRRRGDRPARSFVPPGGVPGYTPPVGLERNIAEARALLAEAGGIGPDPVELLYVAPDERMCQAMARMWEETLGVRVELRAQESKTFAEDKANHRFMLARGNWYADYNDPTTFLDCLATGNGNNDAGYSNPRLDALLRSASESTDAAARMDLLRQAETIAVEEDCPILPMLHYSEIIAIQPYVHGLYPNARLWFPFRNVTIQR